MESRSFGEYDPRELVTSKSSPIFEANVQSASTLRQLSTPRAFSADDPLFDDRANAASSASQRDKLPLRTAMHPMDAPALISRCGLAHSMVEGIDHGSNPHRVREPVSLRQFTKKTVSHNMLVLLGK